ncbi:MAG: hypothetical protein O2971_09505 [Proteobacteria bacterium]|nr:hypothetical protein [Pseudomonadota bacterium]
MKSRIAHKYLLACLLLFTSTGYADGIRDANRLIQVTEVGKRFESLAEQQTRAIIRTYSSIVSTSVEVALPAQLKNRIAACYVEVYAWDNFKAGIARILADSLSEQEMRILIDFYLDRGLAPREIQTFKDTIAKADHIRRVSAEYMLLNSKGCVVRDAELILGYLANLSASVNNEVAVE